MHPVDTSFFHLDEPILISPWLLQVQCLIPILLLGSVPFIHVLSFPYPSFAGEHLGCLLFFMIIKKAMINTHYRFLNEHKVLFLYIDYISEFPCVYSSISLCLWF